MKQLDNILSLVWKVVGILVGLCAIASILFVVLSPIVAFLMYYFEQ